ncbi:MAG: SusD/RagB family nutrient-binding outer membrane lipoprotein, partial [Bacteroidota bacterium]
SKADQSVFFGSQNFGLPPNQNWINMKFINKFLLIAALLFSVSACEMTELEELLDNPNAVTPEQAGVDFLYNSIQLNFAGAFSSTWGPGAFFSRMGNPGGGGLSYRSAYPATSQNGIWNIAYAGLFPDIDALIALGEQRGLDVHVGSVKIMKAYVLTLLVDLMNDVPLSQALQGTDVISPAPDAAADVYAAAEALLDEAIAGISGSSATGPSNDFYYGGDGSKWVTLAKTLKLRLYNTTRLVDSGAAGKINALLADGDLIDDVSEDFQALYGQSRNNPNSRHPFYNNSYEANDGTYQSNYFMWLMTGDKLDENDAPVRDPRARYYFYRQVRSSYDQDVNVYSCIFAETSNEEDINNAKPAHYVANGSRTPFCVLPGGYYGRDHGNGSGIPPDGFIRTVYGLYPGGGKFDDDSFGSTQNNGTDGGQGQGIEPIMLSSYVDFMRAEAALTLGTSDDPRTLLESGIQKSMDKVVSFESLVPSDMGRLITTPSGERSVKDLFGADADDIRAYIDFVLAQYDAATTDDERLNIIMKEYLISLSDLRYYSGSRGQLGTTMNEQTHLVQARCEAEYS